MGTRWIGRWSVWLMGSLVIGIAAQAFAGETATDSPGYDVARLIEIRPAGGKVVGPGADVMPQALVEKAKGVPHMAKVEPYLRARPNSPSRLVWASRTWWARGWRR